MRILMITSEAVPFAKTGGLADVVSALSYALKKLGHEVRIVMPRYYKIDRRHLMPIPGALGVRIGLQEYWNQYFRTPIYRCILSITKTASGGMVFTDQASNPITMITRNGFLFSVMPLFSCAVSSTGCLILCMRTIGRPLWCRFS